MKTPIGLCDASLYLAGKLTSLWQFHCCVASWKMKGVSQMEAHHLQNHIPETETHTLSTLESVFILFFYGTQTKRNSAHCYMMVCLPTKYLHGGSQVLNPCLPHWQTVIEPSAAVSRSTQTELKSRHSHMECGNNNQFLNCSVQCLFLIISLIYQGNGLLTIGIVMIKSRSLCMGPESMQ